MFCQLRQDKRIDLHIWGLNNKPTESFGGDSLSNWLSGNLEFLSLFSKFIQLINSLFGILLRQRSFIRWTWPWLWWWKGFKRVRTLLSWRTLMGSVPCRIATEHKMYRMAFWGLWPWGCFGPNRKVVHSAPTSTGNRPGPPLPTPTLGQFDILLCKSGRKCHRWVYAS